MGYFSRKLRGYGILNTIFGICNFAARAGVSYLPGIASDFFFFFLTRFARSVYIELEINYILWHAKSIQFNCSLAVSINAFLVFLNFLRSGIKCIC